MNPMTIQTQQVPGLTWNTWFRQSVSGNLNVKVDAKDQAHGNVVLIVIGTNLTNEIRVTQEINVLTGKSPLPLR